MEYLDQCLISKSLRNIGCMCVVVVNSKRGVGRGYQILQLFYDFSILVTIEIDFSVLKAGKSAIFLPVSATEVPNEDSQTFLLYFLRVKW